MKTGESFSRMPLLQTLRCTLPVCGKKADRAVISFATGNQTWQMKLRINIYTELHLWQLRTSSSGPRQIPSGAGTMWGSWGPVRLHFHEFREERHSFVTFQLCQNGTLLSRAGRRCYLLDLIYLDKTGFPCLCPGLVIIFFHKQHLILIFPLFFSTLRNLPLKYSLPDPKSWQFPCSHSLPTLSPPWRH